MQEYLFNVFDHKIQFITEQPQLKNLPDGKYKLVLKKTRGKVSSNQYGYYYGVIIKYWKEETGYGDYQQDFELKREFARYKGNLNKHGNPIVPSKSRDFDTKDQEELNRFARETYYDMFNANIPLPNETDYDY